MRIYTRKGDDGSTGLYGGRRIGKAEPRVVAYGDVDELNAVLGWVRAAALPPALDDLLDRQQHACFRLGAWLACPPGADPGVAPLAAEDVASLEDAMDRLEEDLPPLKRFILPGGSEAGARLHVARTVARRAERSLVALIHLEAVPDAFLPWLNRLSDLLFVAARTANAAAGRREEPWEGRDR